VDAVYEFKKMAGKVRAFFFFFFFFFFAVGLYGSLMRIDIDVFRHCC